MSDKASLLRLLGEMKYATRTEKAFIAEESIVKLFDTVRDEFEIEKANLTSLIQRMSEVGDELSDLMIGWDEWNTEKYYCHHSIGDCSPAIHWQDIVHAPNCPVTKWQEIRKEMEG